MTFTIKYYKSRDVPSPMITLNRSGELSAFEHDRTGVMTVKISNDSTTDILYRLSMLCHPDHECQYRLELPSTNGDRVLKAKEKLDVEVHKDRTDSSGYKSLFRQDLLAIEAIECTSSADDQDADVNQISMWENLWAPQKGYAVINAYGLAVPYNVVPEDERLKQALKVNFQDHRAALDAEYEELERNWNTRDVSLMGESQPQPQSINRLGTSRPPPRRWIPFQDPEGGSPGGFWSLSSVDPALCLSNTKELVSIWKCNVMRANKLAAETKLFVVKIFLDSTGVIPGIPPIPSPDGFSFIKRVRNELAKTATVKHENLVSLAGFSLCPWAAIIMPFYVNGNVLEYIGLIGEDATPALRFSFIKDLSGGVWYLHTRSRPIVHGDMKPDNAMVDDKEGNPGFPTVILIDMGLAYYEEDAEDRLTMRGAKNFLAPEVFDTGRKSRESDMWAFAATAFSIAVGEWVSVPSYYPKGPVLPSRTTYSREKYPWLSDEFWELITDCWKKAPAARPNIIQFRDRLLELRVTDWTRLHT